MDGGIVSFVMFWSVVGGVTLLVLAARRLRRSWPWRGGREHSGGVRCLALRRDLDPTARHEDARRRRGGPGRGHAPSHGLPGLLRCGEL